MNEIRGWMLDVYAHPAGGAVVWLLDEEGRRRRLRQDFEATIYAAGSAWRLRELWMYLQKQPIKMQLARTERRDLFRGDTVTLAASTGALTELPGLVRGAQAAFPDLTFYDADLQTALRHAAAFGTFPLAWCNVSVDEEERIHELQVDDSRWEIDYELPPLRAMRMEPDEDPRQREPRAILLSAGNQSMGIDLREGGKTLFWLNYFLKRHDPDLILTAGGDTWILPRLLERAEQEGQPLQLNRDREGRILRKRERSYFAYNQIIYRGQQVHLAGRLHLDIHNTVMYQDYGVNGVLEMARVTGLPIQTAARVSPGTGISAMQIVTALQQGILVPLLKEQTEASKTSLELLQADMGGMVYDPIIGLHEKVGEVDFASMYPSIMAHFNISPETVGKWEATMAAVNALRPVWKAEEMGLIPRTLSPLLEKRLQLKALLLRLSTWDCRYARTKALAAAHKWLLVTCFGYLGYKNARFGKIEAHEAVTAFGREIMLRAKEAAEEMGFRVLHIYVDGMWVQKEGCRTPEDFQPLLKEITTRTGLPIALEGVYRWVAFLASRRNLKIPVPNRYFGVFQDGEIKTRGIETRRHDTPAFIRDTQMQILEILGKAKEARGLQECLPEIWGLMRARERELYGGRVPLEKLVVHQTVSRNLEEFRMPSPVAEALRQLAAEGKSMRPGQSGRLIYTLGRPRASAWDLCAAPDPRRVDVRRYRRLLQRAEQAVLEPIFTAEGMKEWKQGVLEI